jgi:hypothetical protein
LLFVIISFRGCYHNNSILLIGLLESIVTANSTKNGLLFFIIEATLESGPPAASQFTIARISPTRR